MKLRDNQSGVVSMIVSITIMIIISLLVISFARLMRAEQEEALDRQLSSQAYYAAEAAVNDARDAFFAGELEPERAECQTDNGPLSQNELLSGGVSLYTCVTVDSLPNTLVYDNVGVDRSTITEIRAFNDSGNPQNISDITIAWEDPERNTTFATGTTFELPTFQEWIDQDIGPGVLRVDLVPLPAAGYDREYLRDNTQVLFLYPSEAGSNSYNWSAAAAQKGTIVSGRCSTSLSDFRHCEATIDNLPLQAGDSYLLRMKSIYSPSSVTVSAILEGTANRLASFADAQLVIDATGQAQNVLRRVEERSPLAFTYDFPEYALDIGNNLCKRLNVFGDTVTVDIPSGSSSLGACQP